MDSQMWCFCFKAAPFRSWFNEVLSGVARGVHQGHLPLLFSPKDKSWSNKLWLLTVIPTLKVVLVVFRVGKDHRKAAYKAISFLTNLSHTRATKQKAKIHFKLWNCHSADFLPTSSKNILWKCHTSLNQVMSKVALLISSFRHYCSRCNWTQTKQLTIICI